MRKLLSEEFFRSIPLFLPSVKPERSGPEPAERFFRRNYAKSGISP